MKQNMVVLILTDEARSETRVTGVQLPISPSNGDTVEIDGGEHYCVRHVVTGAHSTQIICEKHPISVLCPSSYPAEGYAIQYVGNDFGINAPAFSEIKLEVQPRNGDIVNVDGHHYVVDHLQIAPKGVVVVLKQGEVDIFGKLLETTLA